MVKNILVVRSDRFGEFLLNIPAIRALKQAYPRAKLSIAVDSAVSELANVLDCVDQVLIWDKVKQHLRKYRFNLCVILNPTKEAHWAVFWAGIHTRVGYDRKWGALLTHKIKDTKYRGDRHEVDCNLELVELLGIKSAERTPRIQINDNLIREFVVQTNGQSFEGAVSTLLVAIHPFTSDPVKQWPVKRFMELAQKIMQEMKVKVVFVGKTDDQNLAKQPVPRGSIDLINKTSLVELAALLKRCSLLISCDSGPMHLAAAVGTPVLALFRNDLLGKTAQRWGPAGEGHVIIQTSNLSDISVDEVFNKAQEALKK